MRAFSFNVLGTSLSEHHQTAALTKPRAQADSRFLQSLSPRPWTRFKQESCMNVHHEDIQQRLGFIDRTIYHALRACLADDSVPDELKDYVRQLGRRSRQAQRALKARDERRVRQSVDDLALISDQAQNAIPPTDDMNYEVRSAVILTHIELSALRYRLI
jgi:hypothetical protein